ncbi:MAG: hypothetical protein SFU25_03435, partial [Candidatus Caenarcaniphilales bacterium]|nr:hypothetical protein [Candidatus Caenarcaniphilales bacterium]
MRINLNQQFFHSKRSLAKSPFNNNRKKEFLRSSAITSFGAFSRDLTAFGQRFNLDANLLSLVIKGPSILDIQMVRRVYDQGVRLLQIVDQIENFSIQYQPQFANEFSGKLFEQFVKSCLASHILMLSIPENALHALSLGSQNNEQPSLTLQAEAAHKLLDKLTQTIDSGRTRAAGWSVFGETFQDMSGIDGSVLQIGKQIAKTFEANYFLSQVYSVVEAFYSNVYKVLIKKLILKSSLPDCLNHETILPGDTRSFLKKFQQT